MSIKNRGSPLAILTYGLSRATTLLPTAGHNVIEALSKIEISGDKDMS